MKLQCLQLLHSTLQTPGTRTSVESVEVGSAGMVQLSAAAGHQAATVGRVEQDWSKCYLFWESRGGDGDAVTADTRGGVRHRVRH